MKRKRKNPHAQALGRLGGLRKTPAKARAARANGKLGVRARTIRQDKAPAAKEIE